MIAQTGTEEDAAQKLIDDYCRERHWRLYGKASKHGDEWRALVSMEVSGPMLLVAFKQAPAA